MIRAHVIPFRLLGRGVLVVGVECLRIIRWIVRRHPFELFVGWVTVAILLLLLCCAPSFQCLPTPHYGTSASDFLFFKFSWWGCFYVPVRMVNVGAVRGGTPTTNDQPAIKQLNKILGAVIRYNNYLNESAVQYCCMWIVTKRSPTIRRVKLHRDNRLSLLHNLQFST